MELLSFLSHIFSGFPVNTSGNMTCPFPLSSCSHKHFYAHYILISLVGDHFPKLAKHIHVFLNLKCTFFLFFFPKILITFQNLAQMCFFQGKLSWYTQDKLFLLLHYHCAMFVTYRFYIILFYWVLSYVSVCKYLEGRYHSLFVLFSA